MENRYRVISSKILLTVFLPVFFLSSVHIHNSVKSPDEYCSICETGVHHTHISHNGAEHHCVLCKFLATPFLTATTYISLFFIKFERILAVCYTEELPAPSLSTTSRGPPYIS